MHSIPPEASEWARLWTMGQDSHSNNTKVLTDFNKGGISRCPDLAVPSKGAHHGVPLHHHCTDAVAFEWPTTLADTANAVNTNCNPVQTRQFGIMFEYQQGSIDKLRRYYLEVLQKAGGDVFDPNTKVDEEICKILRDERPFNDRRDTARRIMSNKKKKKVVHRLYNVVCYGTEIGEASHPTR
ncbi:hypothetical protein BDV97DRAFT_341845 [Delphinella strobiligena]|nr:hypothetical protein BDV97DRAFT_341845 [Delphinella strobiligena]